MRFICEVFLTALFLFPVLLVFLYSMLTRRPSGTFIINNYGNCTIQYDINGVPTIAGENTKSVAFATGFAHAADRLWEMNLKRLLIQGRASEVS